MLLIAVRVAETPHIVTVAEEVVKGKPVPVRIIKYPPLSVPEVILRLVKVNGKSKGVTAGNSATFPTGSTVTIGI